MYIYICIFPGDIKNYIKLYKTIYTYICMYDYIYMCVCVCVNRRWCFSRLRLKHAKRCEAPASFQVKYINI